MIEVKTMKRYKCDFCKKRSTRSVMILHEKRCYRNPNRFCDNCDNSGFTFVEPEYLDGFRTEKIKEPCYYCSKFDANQLKEIEEREIKAVHNFPCTPL